MFLKRILVESSTGRVVIWFSQRNKEGRRRRRHHFTPLHRVPSQLLLKRTRRKDNVVGYRCVHILTAMVAYLDEIDEDVYLLLGTALIERILGKESASTVKQSSRFRKFWDQKSPDRISLGERPRRTLSWTASMLLVVTKRTRKRKQRRE
ncbi:hypothetical protein JVU11DRAFT_3975 [Chiua virens]|nr:hypothetical protein JVU11DRAFT_3975 [Chiua virens]